MDGRGYDAQGALTQCGCGSAPSRREFLMGVGATLSLANASIALSRVPKVNIVDVHHHFDPNQVVAGSLPPSPPMPGGWSLTKDLEDMERGGVTTAMLSWFSSLADPGEGRRRAARAINEAGARLVSDHVGRFALLANLPIPDLDASLAELV